MQQNVRLITFPISIFTTITNLAEFCPWKKAILRIYLLWNTSHFLILISSCSKISIEFSPCDTFYRLEALLAQNGQTHKRNWWAHT